MQTIKTISDLFKEYPIKAAGIARKLGIDRTVQYSIKHFRKSKLADKL